MVSTDIKRGKPAGYESAGRNKKGRKDECYTKKEQGDGREMVVIRIISQEKQHLQERPRKQLHSANATI